MNIKNYFTDKQGELGLVLCGGGGKGAYQIGVWKYLRKYHLDKKITGISGVSIGSINSLLFAQNDFEKAVAAWQNATQENFTMPNETIAAEEEISRASKFVQKIKAVNNDFLGTTAKYSQVGIENMIVENIYKKDDIFGRLKYAYVTTCRIDAAATFENDYHLPLVKEVLNLKGKSFYEIKEYCLASSAVPFAYPPRKIGIYSYYDGGALDNIPVKPLVDAGYREIIVVHLRTADDKTEIKRHETSFEGIDFDKVKIHEIFPSDAGVLGDTMEISPRKTKWRIEMGFEDAAEQLPVERVFGGYRII